MEIVEQIRGLIKEGKLKPGDKLPPEHILAEKFGTSRPSVREALSTLEILGIIESRGEKDNFIKNSFNSALYEKEWDGLIQQTGQRCLLNQKELYLQW